MPDWDHPQPFILSIKVSAGDIDELGHVNNATYVRWMEICAWRHSESLHLSMCDYRRLDRAMVVLRHEIDYLAAAFANEQIQVATWIVKSDGKLRLTRHFQITRPDDGLTLLRAQSTFVCMELSSGRAKRMPEEFISRYGGAVIGEKGSLCD
ncbi:acyl-CoA thioesterase [Pseudohongiella spirulinae]|nr:thioesterase family protein [Pseudohongiella spirulinae]